MLANVSNIKLGRQLQGRECIDYLQRIRGFTTMRYINLRFTYLLTY